MNVKQIKPIVLASGSPRRRSYLERYGLKFEVKKADIDESTLPNEVPIDFAVRMASEKAQAVLETCENTTAVIAADTIVVLEKEVLGKPGKREEILPMLKKLNGKMHQVITAYQIVDKSTNQTINRSALTEVQFNQLDNELLASYAKSEEPIDKAGSYSIQGLGTLLVKSINGSYNNVVGLPIEMVLQDLIDLKVIEPI